MHNDIKAAVDSGKLSYLKSVFCDALDGDPTFEGYLEDYEYCKAQGVLFEPHIELHPMSLENISAEYWVQLKEDFKKNPSVRRMEHMREAARILYSERIRKIEAERAKRTAPVPAPAVERKPEPIPEPPKPPAPQVRRPSPYNNPMNGSVGLQKRPVENNVNPNVNNGDGIRRTKERIVTNYNQPQNIQPKKESGAVVAGILIIIIIILIVAITATAVVILN